MVLSFIPVSLDPNLGRVWSPICVLFVVLLSFQLCSLILAQEETQPTSAVAQQVIRPGVGQVSGSGAIFDESSRAMQVSLSRLEEHGDMDEVDMVWMEQTSTTRGSSGFQAIDSRQHPAAPEPSEREVYEALCKFYDLLGGGVTWYRTDGWCTEATPICDWWGVKCRPRNDSKQFTAVSGLTLSFNGLRGPALPASLFTISTLQELDLSHNFIQGTLPSTIGNLTNLQVLNLNNNGGLRGVIPESLGISTFSTLRHLDLGGNLFEGPIPASFWWLSHLHFLNLSSNLFHNTTLTNDISSLTSLQRLILSYNRFIGTIPAGMGSLSNLIELDISHNEFSGGLDHVTPMLPNIEVWVGSYNKFNGSSCGLGFLTGARKLLMDHNQLTGELHPYLLLLTNVIALDLSHNNLSGYVPESMLYSLLSGSNLVYFNLMANPELRSWESTMPSFLGTDVHVTTHDHIGAFVCRRLFWKQSPSTSLMVDPSYFYYQHCACVRDSYGVPPDQCYDCPPGAYCPGGKFFTFEPGWYPVVEPLGWKNHTKNPTPDRWEWEEEDQDESEDLAIDTRPTNFRSQIRDIAKSAKHSKAVLGDYQFGYESIPFAPLSKKPLAYQDGPVVLYPCPDLSTNKSACNPLGESVFYYNSSTAFGIQNNGSLCSTGYDLRLCTFCTCAAASNPSCTDSPLRKLDGSESDANMDTLDCSCYYRSGLRCVKCERVWKFPSTVGLAAALWVIFILLMAFVFYCRKAPAEASPLRFSWIASLAKKLPNELRHSGYLKILVVYLQTLSAVSKDPILTYFKIMMGDIFSFGAICAWPILSDPFWQQLFYLVLPLALLVGLVLSLLLAAFASNVAIRFTRTTPVQEEDYVNDHLIFGGGGQFASESNLPSIKPAKDHEYSLVCQGFSVILTVYWWFLFGVSFRALSVFNCASDPLSSFLETQPWIGCSSPQWRGLKVLAIIGIVIYTCLVPIVFAILLFVFRKKVNEPNTRTVMEILCASYRSGVFWYELVATARRIGLAAVLALVPGSSAFKMSSVFLVLVVGLYLQIVFRPFVTKFENVMEELSMVTVLLTYAAQYGFNMRFAQMGSLNTVTIVVNFMLLAAIIYTYISRTFFSQYRFLPWSKPPSDEDVGSSLAHIAAPRTQER